MTYISTLGPVGGGWLPKQSTDRLGEPAGFTFDLLPRAARDAPSSHLKLLLSTTVQLESRSGVMKAAAVSLDYQAGISPEEIWLKPATAGINANVDLWGWEIGTVAHPQEESLQFTASPLYLWV